MSIRDKRLILVMGKGGVGRSTVAAMTALSCAQAGRRTLLYQYSANDRFGRMFGLDPVGTEPVELTKHLTAINTTPAAAIEEYGLMVLRFRRIYNMVFENRITKHFLRAVPGLDDYSILGKCWYHAEEEDRGKPVWDTVVFDMAATGHSLSMLKLPWVILETVPDGPLRRDARSIRALLTDKERTGILICTLAEEMPVNEALELEGRLKSDMGLAATQMVVNQVFPDHFPVASPQRNMLDALSENPGPLAPLAAHARTAVARGALNRHYITRLRQETRAPVAELPLLFRPTLGREDIETLAAHWRDQAG